MAEENDLVTMTIEVVASYVAHNNLRPEDVPAFIASTHAAISSLEKSAEGGSEGDVPAAQPAVSVRKSLSSPSHILSLIDGKPYKTLKRHLAANGLTPAQYRERFGLKADYPMVARAYSEERRAVAERLGLGRKPKAGKPVPAAPAAAPAPVATPAAPAAPKTEAKAPRAKSKPAAAPKAVAQPKAEVAAKPAKAVAKAPAAAPKAAADAKAPAVPKAAAASKAAKAEVAPKAPKAAAASKAPAVAAAAPAKGARAPRAKKADAPAS
ncbi:MucR family transcriptional regulator [Flavisphingomonas formosensis]|uniref:MucR family transcriptional regulator n=1 Tax=Flavisphingomonas formosensis TaxID=861534 RepID=UPI0012FCFE3C|nr:MucR family transcriptional regulator [Sphingomonas formosensis]